METVGVWWNFIHSAHESRREKSGPGEILKLGRGGGHPNWSSGEEGKA